MKRLQLDRHESLLDVGCGWGSMLTHAAMSDSTLRLNGLTLSSAQAEHATSRLQGRCEISLVPWQAFKPTETFDGIVSLGALEHFVGPDLSREDRISAYADFFSTAFVWLSGPNRRLCVQTIALEDQQERIRSARDEFFTEEVFPQSSLPRISEVVAAAEPSFRLIEARSDADHYARTCRQWRSRLVEARPQAEALVGEDMFRRYRKMLFAAEMLFVSRSSTLYRLVFERRCERVSVGRGGSDDREFL